MTPAQRIEIITALASLIGYCEGTITVLYLDRGDFEKGQEKIQASAEIQKARALLGKLQREMG